jgi:hypothetical protein
MPLMPRAMKDKGTKIAFKLIGTPANLVKHRKTKQENAVAARLNFEESRLVR